MKIKIGRNTYKHGEKGYKHGYINPYLHRSKSTKKTMNKHVR